MKEYEGKQVKIYYDAGGKIFTYSALLDYVNDTHVGFIDESDNNTRTSLRIKDIKAIKEISQRRKWKWDFWRKKI